jgi:hypothetical protein
MDLGILQEWYHGRATVFFVDACIMPDTCPPLHFFGPFYFAIRCRVVLHRPLLREKEAMSKKAQNVTLVAVVNELA